MAAVLVRAVTALVALVVAVLRKLLTVLLVLLIQAAAAAVASTVPITAALAVPAPWSSGFAPRNPNDNEEG